MSTEIFRKNGHRIVQFASSDGLQLEIWARPWHLDAKQAREVGLALLKWASENGAPLVWAQLPEGMHVQADEAGLVQVLLTKPGEHRVVDLDGKLRPSK